MEPVVDPGCPRGGGANSKGVCEKLLFNQFFSQKLHEIERIWAPGASMAPLIFANGKEIKMCMMDILAQCLPTQNVSGIRHTCGQCVKNAMNPYQFMHQNQSEDFPTPSKPASNLILDGVGRPSNTIHRLRMVSEDFRDHPKSNFDA